jgi:AcrR family transcriptional regulator
MPKGFTDSEKELIRQRLLRAGEKLFTAHGLKKTSVDELAAAAKISKGAFYLFFESKEALFMDVTEMIEVRYREQIFAALALPGPTPRARLFRAFKAAFDQLTTLPILRAFTGGDYDRLFSRIPPEKLQAHLASDLLFFGELVERARAQQIPIVVTADQLSGLLYPLVLAVMHAEDFGLSEFGPSLDRLLELVTAYALGEVTTGLVSAAPRPEGGAA